MKKIISFVLALTLALAMPGLAQAATITVGPGAGYDFGTIQAGIDIANGGDTVLVTPGEYVITEPITFRGKAITVMSETGSDETTIRMGTPDDPERASVVVFENNETDASVLDGFTVTGGRGFRLWVPEESEFDWGGGGIFFDASSGTVKNCAVVQNRVNDVGGGVMVYSGSSLTLTNCNINGNSATTESGGGVCCAYDSSVTMTYCTIAENSAGQVGGGVISYSNSAVTMTYCTIVENSAGQGGGGVFCGENSSSVTMTHCAIVGNTAGLGGGGLEIWHQASAILTNCMIAQNTTAEGGGIICAPYGYQGCSVTVTNSIILGNNATNGREIRVENPATFSISYSNVAGGQAEVLLVQGGTLNWGAGNIDADPYFANPNQDDFHLKSQAGRWDPNGQSWIQDDVTSPCIDRGDPNSPVGNEPDPNGGIINIGAYGGTPEASLSIGQLPPLPPLAHWKLDEAEGDIAYDSAGDKAGLLFAGPVWRPDGGRVAGALQFDGIDDYVSTDPVLNPADRAFSVLAWIKGGAPGQVIISQEGGASWLMADISDGALRTDLRTPEVTSRNAKLAGPPLICSTVVTDGDWHRVGFVWDGSNRILYVDDIEVTRDTAETLESAETGLYIGAASTLDPGGFFSGLIDDVRIYNRALILTESRDMSKEVHIDANDDGSQVELEQGQILVVTLESNPTTGYRWEQAETQESILEQIGEAEFMPSETGEPPLVGAGGWEIFRFTAVSTGQMTLRLVYRRPWEEGVEPLKTFSLQVTVP